MPSDPCDLEPANAPMGTSFIWLMIRLLSFVQGWRVDMAVDALEKTLRRVPSRRLLEREK